MIVRYCGDVSGHSPKFQCQFLCGQSGTHLCGFIDVDFSLKVILPLSLTFFVWNTVFFFFSLLVTLFSVLCGRTIVEDNLFCNEEKVDRKSR